MEGIDNDGIIRRLHADYPIRFIEDEQFFFEIYSCLYGANSIFDQDPDEAIKNYYYSLSINYQTRFPIDIVPIIRPISFNSGISISAIFTKTAENCRKLGHYDLSIWAYCLAYLCDEGNEDIIEKVINATQNQVENFEKRLLDNIFEYFSSTPEEISKYSLEIESLTEFWFMRHRVFFFQSSPILWAQHLTGVLSEQNVEKILNIFIEAKDAISIAAILSTISYNEDKKLDNDLFLINLIKIKGGNLLCINLMKKILKYYPERFKLWEKLGELYEEENNIHDAIDAYSEAINNSTNDPKYQDIIELNKIAIILSEKVGDLNREKNNFDKAIDAYQSGIQAYQKIKNRKQETPFINEISIRINIKIHQCKNELGDTTQPEILISSIESEDNSALIQYAEAFHKTNSRENSLKCFQHLLTRNNLKLDEYEKIITFFHSNDLKKETTQAVNKMFKYGTYSPVEFYKIGVFLEKLELFDEAIRALYNISPIEANINNINLIKMFIRLNQEDIALEYISETSNRNQDIETLIDSIDLLLKKSREREALMLARKFVNFNGNDYDENIDLKFHYQLINYFDSTDSTIISDSLRISLLNYLDKESTQYYTTLQTIAHNQIRLKSILNNLAFTSTFEIENLNYAILLIISGEITQGIQKLEEYICNFPHENEPIFLLIWIYEKMNFNDLANKIMSRLKRKYANDKGEIGFFELFESRNLTINGGEIEIDRDSWVYPVFELICDAFNTNSINDCDHSIQPQIP